MKVIRYVCRRCDMTFNLPIVSVSLAEGTCPSCGQRVQVSMERVQA